MAEERQLRVHSMTWESDGVLGVRLIDPNGELMPPWSPGAHIDVLLPSGGERQYSLCSDPGDRSSWRIGVLQEPKSRGGSEWIHTTLRPGDTISVRGPRNNFGLAEVGHYIFIAGGIGITPILPMIAEVERRGAPWSLVYGGRRRDSMAFVPELEVYGDKVTLWPEDLCGRIDLAAVLAPAPDTAVYCCGPEPLLAAVEEQCVAWPSGSLRVERFAAKPTVGEVSNDSFEVVLAASGRTLTVSPGQSILGACEANGVFPPSSCLEGTCGTCETAVLEGIPDHRDSLLTDDEKEAGDTMFICVSRARSEKLVLDL